MIRKILSFFRKIIVFIFLTPFSKKIRYKYPRLYYFLTRRFNLRRFSGMPLTLLLVAIFSNLVMMLKVYEDILNLKEFIAIDNTVAKFLFDLRTDLVARLFYIITQLGNEYAILGGVIIMSVIFFIKKKSYRIVALLVSVAGSAMTVMVGKSIFKIARPHSFSYYHIDNYSFPSGHSTAAVAFYGILFYMLITDSKQLKVKFAFLMTGLCVILIIGFSRLYLCEHYLSDVLGGYLLGFLWLLFSISILLWKEDKMRRLKR